MRWAGVLARAVLACAAAAAPQRACAACAALAVNETQALLNNGAVFQKFSSLGRAEWELTNTTLVVLRREDLEQLRMRGNAYTLELAARFRDAVLVAPLALDLYISDVSKSLFANVASRERMLCSLSSVVLEERHTFMSATFGMSVFFRARFPLADQSRCALHMLDSVPEPGPVVGTGGASP